MTQEFGPLSSMRGMGPRSTLEVMLKAYAEVAKETVALEYCPMPCASYAKMLANWPRNWKEPLDHPVFHAAQRLFPAVFT